MGELHKKYRKFITTAASAALVASAVAPVASAKSFSDTKGNTHEAAIDALSDAGVISGYPDGTFQPNKTLTRSDVVKLMGKWLVSEGYAIPSDAVSNPRFADLKSTSNKELLEYAAVVKDNGVFVGTPDGKLDPAGNITRENMAIVLVRAFDRVNDIDLTAFVAGEDFKKDVTDLGSAKAEARPAIDVLDFFDITNPAAPAFNPKATTTRGHFATFLHKFSTTDFSNVAPGTVVGKTAVKAVNATTVEVTFKDAVENVNSLNFTIEGLTVSNAATKQSDDKTVVLTTAVQEGGKEYTVSLDGKAIGKFKGVSAVVPTKINITTQSVQGKVGQQAIVSADVGVKQAGIAVTFNVKADTTGTLNKDQVFEAVTDENGIATFSYTQYAAGTDEVVAYPTGAPTVRSHAFVFWGVNTILTIAPTDEKGNSVNNGADKTYKLTYLDPKTGKPVANQRFFVTFEENINVTIDKTSKATVNGVNPQQLLNNESPTVASVTTDAKGEAVFTVSGLNTEVTPIVFFDNNAKDERDAKTYEPSKLQAKAETVTFSAPQKAYMIEIFGSLSESSEAAVGIENGREFTAMVMGEDGEPAANEVINFAFNEDLDRNLNTKTNAWFVDWEDGGELKKQISYKTNEYGEIIFNIASEDVNDYATIFAWIDLNSADAREGKFDEGEPSQVGPITYFAKEKLSVASLFVNDGNGAIPRTDKKEFLGTDVANFEYFPLNQSFMPVDLPAEYSHLEATFTIWNTGAEDVKVTYTASNGIIQSHVISPNRSLTTPTLSGTKYTNPEINVESIDNKSTSVKVVANGTAQPDKTLANNKAVPLNFGSSEAKAEFVSTLAVGSIHTGIVESINTEKKEIKFYNKNKVSYKGATYKNTNAVELTVKEFEDLIAANVTTAKVTYKKSGDNVTFEIVSLNATASALSEKINNATTGAEVLELLNADTVYAAKLAKLAADDRAAIADALFAGTPGNGYTETGFIASFNREYVKYVTLESAVYTLANAGTPAKAATGTLEVSGKKLAVTGPAGAAYNDFKVVFIADGAVAAGNDPTATLVGKVLTVNLPATVVDAIAGEVTIDTTNATYAKVLAAIEGHATTDLTVDLDGLSGDASALKGEEIVLSGGEAGVDAIPTTLVLTFSEAVTLAPGVTVDVKDAAGATTIATADDQSVDGNKVTLKFTTPSEQAKVVNAVSVTDVANITVAGKTVSIDSVKIQK